MTSLRMMGIVLVCLIGLAHSSSVANVGHSAFVMGTRSAPVAGVGLLPLTEFLQGPDLDYSNFKHNSSRHASIGCNSCHQRAGDNSTVPRIPGHSACTSCHLAQFVTPSAPLCSICHVDVKSAPPPLKAFPATFKESFNVKFDHAQHMSGAARPGNGCVACHSRPLSRGAGLSIPARIAAHTQCYVCHTPTSRSAKGNEIASCGVCHEARPFARTSTNARAFRLGFSHADHGSRQKLNCAECHKLTAGAPHSRQVSSPQSAEHFPSGRGQSCMTCHNGRRTFGGDLAFKDCKRCHEGTTFRTGQSPAVSEGSPNQRSAFLPGFGDRPLSLDTFIEASRAILRRRLEISIFASSGSLASDLRRASFKASNSETSGYFFI